MVVLGLCRLELDLRIEQLKIPCESRLESDLEFQAALDILSIKQDLTTLLNDFVHASLL